VIWPAPHDDGDVRGLDEKPIFGGGRGFGSDDAFTLLTPEPVRGLDDFEGQWARPGSQYTARQGSRFRLFAFFRTAAGGVNIDFGQMLSPIVALP